MVRLKIAYWESDFEAVCPTLDHDLLSQAHIHTHIHKMRTRQYMSTLQKSADNSHQALPWWGACRHSATILDFLTTIRCDGVFTEAFRQSTTSALTHLWHQITY